MLRLKELRKKKNLTQKEFGDLWGASQNTVSNWENGNRELSTELLVSFSRYFGVSVDYLLGRDEPVGSDRTNATNNHPGHRAEGKAILDQMTEEDYERALAVLRALQK